MQGTLDPIAIKGTRHGLLICLREAADFGAAVQALRDHLTQNSSFLGGASVSVDLGWRETTPDQFSLLEETLAACQVTLQGVLSTSQATRTLAESRGYRAII
ncbi:MAG: hypothetical protein AB1758_03625, partial [Candidatus Eremiobacterota bacterium]